MHVDEAADGTHRERRVVMSSVDGDKASHGGTNRASLPALSVKETARGSQKLP